MTHSYTITDSNTFTKTHAKYLASKVIADMRRCQQVYRSPSDVQITSYETELIDLLSKGYVKSYEFGFHRENRRIVSWKYHVSFGDLVGGDDSPGNVFRKAEISNASFFNFLTRSDKWWNLSEEERANFEKQLPFIRSIGSEKENGAGYWVTDKNYSSSGCQLGRQTFRPF